MRILRRGIKAYKTAAYIASSIGALGSAWLARDKLIGWGGDFVSFLCSAFLVALDYPIALTTSVTLAVLVLGYALITRRALHLLRHCLADEKPDPWLFTVKDSVRLIRVSRRWPTRARARIWVEYFLLRPEPPRPELPDADGGARNAEMQKAEQRWTEWRKDLRRLLQQKEGERVISIDSCDTMISVRKRLIDYFDYVEKRELAPQTLCTVKVRRGFLAPTFLVTGLIQAFKDDWDPIVNAYGRQVHDQKPHYARYFLKSPGTERDFAAFRLFQFNCWLLWGPSIPVCSCGQWGGDVFAFQFGFGDENNSIEVVTDLSSTEDKVRSIIRARGGDISAGSARIKGPLKAAKSIASQLSSAQMRLLGQPLRKKDPERLAIEVSGPKKMKTGKQDADGANNFYYSAYIWVMFVVCDKEGNLLFPHQPAPRNMPKYDHRWRNLLPFFVHGNIADGPTYRRHKEMLAYQISGIVKQTLRDHQDISLRYACALDESACGWPTFVNAPPGQYGQGRRDDRALEGERSAEVASSPPPGIGRPYPDSIRAILAQAIANDSVLKAFAAEGRLYVPGVAPVAPGVEVNYASCHLPDIIIEYYEQPRFSEDDGGQSAR